MYLYLDTYVAFCLDLRVCNPCFHLKISRLSLSACVLFCYPNREVIGKLYVVSLCLPDTYGLLNFLIPGTSFYSTIEASSWLVSTLLGLACDERLIFLSSFVCQIMHTCFGYMHVLLHLTPFWVQIFVPSSFLLSCWSTHCELMLPHLLL